MHYMINCFKMCLLKGTFQFNKKLWKHFLLPFSNLCTVAKIKQNISMDKITKIFVIYNSIMNALFVFKFFFLLKYHIDESRYNCFIEWIKAKWMNIQ